MRKYYLLFVSLLIVQLTRSQSLSPLTVDKIMRDPKWMGTSPSNPRWSADGSMILFNWNPEQAIADSVYLYNTTMQAPRKGNYEERQTILHAQVRYNKDYNAYVYTKNGDLFYKDLKGKKELRITETVDAESSPRFSNNDQHIIFSRDQNLFIWDIKSGSTKQLTNFQKPASGSPVVQKKETGSEQEQWLKKDQLSELEVLKVRKEKRDLAAEATKKDPKEKKIRVIALEDKSLQDVAISPDLRYVVYRLFKMSPAKSTLVPSYVTESGYTEDIISRSKVGSPQGTSQTFIYDTQKDTVYPIKVAEIPGIYNLPTYVHEYPKIKDEMTKNNSLREVVISSPVWSSEGTHALVDIRSQDNKDRWIMELDTETGKLKLQDRQHDDAWIGGPGVGWFAEPNLGWLNDQQFYFQSEVSGYSHLYVSNIINGERKSVTQGKYEVQQVKLSRDKKNFYVITNEVHPGEQHWYRISVDGNKKEKITSLTGANQVSMSPDEKSLAILHSYSNKPWEMYWMENKAGGKIQQVTNKAMSDEFRSYAWREPKVITFRARDGAEVYARLYVPVTPDPKKPAVIFVHGAGYLQNAHKWWSSYFREYMFHNLLSDLGYHVLDIDYRASAGYGRDWRTGIYRFMGGKDLTDQVDGARWLTENYGVDSKRIGIYGGSYGGFITLMAQFTTPGVFKAGAALRPVTDWAHYNHGYTANILNEPHRDSISYRRSSPIYHAAGLQDHLLICHGMVDVNVHFQDVVRLTQRLIELKKENWELAVYPLEDHGFVEPSSWRDEYDRILKLFEKTLKE